MGNIAVISYAEKVHKGRFKKDTVCGEEIFSINIKKKGKRQLKRALERYNIDRAVIEGTTPDFVQNVLSEKDIKICNGKAFIKKLLPTLLARASKYDINVSFCTVYAEKADSQTAEIIKEASKRFRFVSLCSEDVNSESIAYYIMEETGLALDFSEYENGTAVICNGTGGNQSIKIDMVSFKGIVLTDENSRKISVPLAEAICGEQKTIGDMKMKLKLYKI